MSAWTASPGRSEPGLRFVRYAPPPVKRGDYPVDAPLAAKVRLPYLTGYPMVFSSDAGARVTFRVAGAPLASGEDAPVHVTRYVVRDAARGTVLHSDNLPEPIVVRREAPHSYRDEGAGYTTVIALETASLPPTFCELVLIDSENKQSERIYFNLRPTDDTIYQCICVLPTFTWQAYNFVGGGSFYTKNIGDPRVITLHRPLLTRGPNDCQLVLPLFDTIVKAGYSFYCLDNMDVHNGLLSTAHAAVTVLMVHDEYFTHAMRTHINGFLGAGGSVVVIGGNTCCRVTTIDGDNLCDLKGTPGNDYWESSQAENPTETTFGLAWRFGGYPLHRTAMVELAISLPPTDEQVRQGGGMRVLSASHPIFAGTDLKENDWFGVDVGLMNCEADGVYITSGGRVDWRSCPLVPRKATVLASGIVAGIGYDRGLRDVGVIVDTPSGRGRVLNLGTMGWPRGLGGKDLVCEKIVMNAIELAGTSAAVALRRSWRN